MGNALGANTGINVGACTGQKILAVYPLAAVELGKAVVAAEGGGLRAPKSSVTSSVDEALQAVGRVRVVMGVPVQALFEK